MSATPEALAHIPVTTVWPNADMVPATTIIAGHIKGCRTQGGTVSPYACPRCSRNVEWKYRSALARLDSRAGGR